MGDSVTPEIIGNMIRQYFSQERPEEETIQALITCAECFMKSVLLHMSQWTVCCG